MAAGAGAFAWAAFPAMPTRRVYCSAAHRDGQLFVLGGCGGGGRALGAAEVLDLPAQRWTVLPPLPTPRAGAAALVLGKQILVVGGVDVAQSPLASVEVYHVDEGKWEKKAALAQPSMGISAVQRDGAIYALGGMGADTSPQALVRVYEPAKDHWQPLPSMPTPCYGASAFLQGNKIFVLGGRQGKLPVTAFEAFDLETRSWMRYPSMPSRRAFAACAMADGIVFSLGGLQQPGPHNFYSRPHFVNTVEMFDPAQGVWSKSSRTIRMREKRADFVAGCLGGRVVAVGGLGNARGFPQPMCSMLGSHSPRRLSPAVHSCSAESFSRETWGKVTSRAHWTQWKGSASHGRSGSHCPPCPPAAAPAPAAQHLACSSSSVGSPRVPAAPSRLCACARHPEWDQPRPSTKCLKTGTGCARARAWG